MKIKTFLHTFLILIFIMLAGIFNAQAQQKNTERDLALEYYRKMDYEKALPIFEKLYDNNQSDFHYHYYFHCLIEVRDYKKAEKLVKRHLKANNKNPRYEVDLGYVLITSGDVLKGKKQYDDIIKNLPADKRTIIDVANALISKRENDYAIKVYHRGRVLLSENDAFQMELGNLYDRMGDFENMVNEYLNLVKTDVKNLQQIQTRLQNSLFSDTEGTRLKYLRTSLLRNIRQYPDVNVYSELMLWLSIQQSDFESAYIQAVALDKRLNENGKRVYSIAKLSTTNNDFDVAIKSYEYIITKGPENQHYMNARIEILKAETKRLASVNPLNQEYLSLLEKRYNETLAEFGKNRLTISLMRDLANLYAFMFYDADKAIELLNEALAIKGLGKEKLAECKLDLADVLLYAGEIWEATLLYSQVEKELPNEPIGHEAKFRNARLSFYIGEFEWARAQLNVLKAATSKLIANDAMALSLLIKDNMEPDSTYVALEYYARAELHSYRQRDDLALQVLDSITTLFPYHLINDDVLYKRAEISIRRGEYDNASTYLEEIVMQYPSELLADKALFKLAEIYDVYLKEPDKAMEYYKELMLNYPASLFADPARQRFRILRGDVI